MTFRRISPTYSLCRTESCKNVMHSKSLHEGLYGGPSSPHFLFFTFLISFTNLSRDISIFSSPHQLCTQPTEGKKKFLIHGFVQKSCIYLIMMIWLSSILYLPVQRLLSKSSLFFWDPDMISNWSAKGRENRVRFLWFSPPSSTSSNNRIWCEMAGLKQKQLQLLFTHAFAMT